MKELLRKTLCILIVTVIFTMPVLAVDTDELYDQDDSYEPYEPVTELEHVRMAAPSRVIISDFLVVGGGLSAGETSTVVFVLRNTGQYADINSVVLTGWIDSDAPVSFVDTNQAYAGRIPPGEEIFVMIDYYTRNVNLTALKSVPVGFNISYGDEATNSERTSSVTVLLPVLHGAVTVVNEEEMHWVLPHVSNFDEFMSSRIMQTVYVTVLVVCIILIILKLLFKVGLLKLKL